MSGATDRPSLPTGLLASGAGALFGGLATLRGTRAVHPQGVVFAATVALRDGPGLALVPAFGPPRTVPALVRLSRGFGLPRRLPDPLGIAVRLPDLHGPGRHQDLLMVSSLGDGLGLLALVPARRFSWATYSGVMPYRSAGRLVVPGARGAGAAADDGTDALAAARRAAVSGRLRFALAVAPLGGRLQPLGELRVGPPLPAADAALLRFDPLTGGDAFVPAAGPLNAIRRVAYAASRRRGPDAGRGAVSGGP